MSPDPASPYMFVMGRSTPERHDKDVKCVRGWISSYMESLGFVPRITEQNETRTIYEIGFPGVNLARVKSLIHKQ